MSRRGCGPPSAASPERSTERTRAATCSDARIASAAIHSGGGDEGATADEVEVRHIVGPEVRVDHARPWIGPHPVSPDLVRRGREGAGPNVGGPHLPQDPRPDRLGLLERIPLIAADIVRNV